MLYLFLFQPFYKFFTVFYLTNEVRLQFVWCVAQERMLILPWGLFQILFSWDCQKFSQRRVSFKDNIINTNLINKNIWIKIFKTIEYYQIFPCIKLIFNKKWSIICTNLLEFALDCKELVIIWIHSHDMRVF